MTVAIVPAVWRITVAVVATTVAWSHAASQTTYRLAEDLRIGGADVGPTSFSQVGAIAVALNGNVFVLDFTPAPQVRVFDSAGRFVADAGRSGGGPGEYRFVSAMLAAEGGVSVVDVYGSRLLRFDDRGALLEHRQLQFGILVRAWHGAILNDGTVLDPVYVGPRDGVPVTDTPPRPYLRRLRPDGVVQDTFPAPHCEIRNRPSVPSIRLGGTGGGFTIVQIPFLPRPQSRDCRRRGGR
jgi:hypothetical protein